MAPRWILSGAVLAGALLVGASAQAQQAQGFSEQYPAVLTFENIGGVMYVRTKTGTGDPQKYTTVGTFASLGAGAPNPQLGFHYFVAPPLSLGVGVIYSDMDAAGSVFEIEPRIGVAFPIESGTAVWLRAGGTYFNYNEGSGDYSPTTSGFAPGGEVLLVLQPVEHFGFLFGARCLVSVGAKEKSKTFVVSSSGTGTSTNTEDFSMIQAGLTVGIMSDF